MPRYYVQYIVYHEMLHASMRKELASAPPTGKRRAVHTGRFKELESRFRDYARAMSWEQQHI